ncbi:hypothetical protein [Microviridae Fen7895_21]|uniref:hypothetical protein n=1 Tax=Microviridae Fen7895_21 TaxID=1655660 RepID=UPI00063D5FB5|nr:hypothetical protein [Microviridae Fen7895_21]AKI26945.1 hypothetical protein [Microviridae Fen7895_21]
MTTNNKQRKFVLTPQQFEELTANPTLATAVFNAFKQSPDMTTLEAFRFARLILAQFSLELKDGSVVDTKINVDTGEIILPSASSTQDEANNTPPTPIQHQVDQKPIKKLPPEGRV